MKFSSFLLVVSLLAFSFCKNKSESALSTAPKTTPIEGTYVGYRSQQQGQQPAADSTQITLQVSRISDKEVQILQTAPNEFKYLVKMQDNNFTYDRGLVEAACGAAQIKGKGSFQNGVLLLVETMECTKNKSTPDSFIRLRAVRK